MFLKTSLYSQFEKRFKFYNKFFLLPISLLCFFLLPFLNLHLVKYSNSFIFINRLVSLLNICINFSFIERLVSLLKVGVKDKSMTPWSGTTIILSCKQLSLNLLKIRIRTQRLSLLFLYFFCQYCLTFWVLLQNRGLLLHEGPPLLQLGHPRSTKPPARYGQSEFCCKKGNYYWIPTIQLYKY